MSTHPALNLLRRPAIFALLVAPAVVVAGAEGCGGSTETTSAGTGGTTSSTSAGTGGTTSSTSAGTGGACADKATVGCTYAYSGYNGSASVKATSTSAWSCSATERSLTANGIPDHDVGTFPNANCPNTISAQTISATMPLDPALKGTTSAITIVGYAWNGVKFDPGTAGTCTSGTAGATCSLIGGSGAWNIEALGQSSFNFGVDDNNAHVQPNGWYHYHGIPEGVLTKLGKGMAMTLVGFALDGFPIYARYGYTSVDDATSAIKVVKGSYALKTTPDSGRPSTATYPMGAFSEDYTYVAGSGDLDECNGRTGVTPEFPCGTYHYYLTDTYPFIQRCVKGTASSSGMMMGPPPDGGMMMGPPPPPDAG